LDEALAHFIATDIPNVGNCSSTSLYNAAKALEKACAKYLNVEGSWTGQASMKISPGGPKNKEYELTEDEQLSCKEYARARTPGPTPVCFTTPNYALPQPHTQALTGRTVLKTLHI
jgi:hypothetical protein